MVAPEKNGDWFFKGVELAVSEVHSLLGGSGGMQNLDLLRVILRPFVVF